MKKTQTNSPSHKNTPCGILLINKPQGHTSFDCLRQVKRALNTKDIGHGGTLDSFATGVLPVFVGEGLKLARLMLEPIADSVIGHKTYEALITLGTQTDTLDSTGVITQEQAIPAGWQTKLEGVVKDFLANAYNQVPPEYSAKKTQGQRSSDILRSTGTAPVLPPVLVQLFELRATALDDQHISLFVHCSKGTYVRSLARDIAQALGTVGYVKELKRVKAGPFKIDECVGLDLNTERLIQSIIPLETACKLLTPPIDVTEDDARLVYQGNGKNVLENLATMYSPGIYSLYTNDKPLALVHIVSAGHALTLRCFKNNPTN